MAEEVISKNIEETKKFAKSFLDEYLKENSSDKALIVGLVGDLGTGKTSFVQAVAKELGVVDQITSPTFVIEKIYRLENQGFEKLIHIDAYRIQKSKELIGLGWEEITNDPKNIIIIEWAERVQDILPENYIKIKFEHLGGDKRKIIVNS